jgi:hypothetical protein
MDLTTTARVNERRGGTGSETTAFVDRLVTEVSADVEAYLCRHAQNIKRIETFKVPKRTKLVQLYGFPVTAVDTIETSTSPTMAGASIAGVSTYDWANYAGSGQLHFESSNAWLDTWARISYWGGMAVDTAAFMLAFPSIAGATEEQIIALMDRAASPEMDTKRMRGGSVEFETGHTLLPNVRRRLDQFRRVYV